MKIIKEFLKGFKSYPLSAYNIGQLLAENLIWTISTACLGILVYLLYKL